MGLYCATSFFPTLRCIHSWKPDVIHAHFAMPTGFLAWAAHGLTRVPYVLTAHLGDVPGGVPEQTATLFPFVAPIARRVWASAAACTAVSTFVKELAERAYERPVERILNGIDLSDAPPPRTLSQSSRRLLFVGRLSVQKNPVFLIEALAKLPRRDWHLTIVGDGPLLPAVRESIEAHGLVANVTLAGWLAAPAVQQALSASEILLMPSLSEGLPVAAIEALKYGLAIVASDIPGMRDVLESGVNGYTFPLGDSAVFAQRLSSLLSSEQMLVAMQQASREKARAFDLTAITDAYERTLRAAATSGRGEGIPC
jgi:glycosyltransferase involved in cell wall biosynthesis